MKYSYYTVNCLILIAVCLVVPGESRGGRGRGSGSFGGIFGGWRSKYGSKSSSSGGGRRVVSGSPVHTAMTVPKLPPPPPPPAKPMSMPKQQLANYPRQQLPPGYSYGSGAGQGTYYSNAQALPTGAMYYPQAPMGLGMGSGTSGLLTGLLAGRLIDGMLFGRHQHVTHVYHQNQPAEGATPNKGQQIVVIENGQPQTEGAAETNLNVDPFDESLKLRNPLSEEEEEQEELSSEEETTTAPPVGGIVCFPIMLNETDPENPELLRQVERVVCFPASSLNPTVDCQNDPLCGSSTTSTEPPIVAGDIGGAADVAEEEEEAAAAEGAMEEEVEGAAEGAVEEEAVTSSIDTVQY